MRPFDGRHTRDSLRNEKYHRNSTALVELFIRHVWNY